MTIVRASAPGKAVLSGEYVVLEGAPAVCVALNRRVLVTLAENSRDTHCVTAPGLIPGEHRFDVDDSGALRWMDPADADVFRLFELVWRKFSVASQPGMSICIDSNVFMHAGSKQKLGLGSSAAVAAALGTALNAWSPGSADIAELVSVAHSDFQNGQGSGVDVATSLHGGVIQFSNRPAMSRTTLAWPPGLYCRFFYSGTAASTAQQIERFHSIQHSAQARQSKYDLKESAEAVAACWNGGDGSDLLQTIGTYVDALLRFSDDFHLEIFTAGHAEMVNLASKHDVVYKPCGAGGGDIGVAFATDEKLLGNFCNEAQALQFAALDVAPDWRGASLETERFS